MSFHVSETEAQTGCRLEVVDDGRVGWAYLLAPDGDVVGDVWLYNRAAAPPAINWREPPFLNPSCVPHRAPPAEAVSVAWLVDEALVLAEVRIDGTALARVSVGASPGWSRWALEDGPCAQKW